MCTRTDGNHILRSGLCLVRGKRKIARIECGMHPLDIGLQDGNVFDRLINTFAESKGDFRLKHDLIECLNRQRRAAGQSLRHEKWPSRRLIHAELLLGGLARIGDLITRNRSQYPGDFPCH